MDSLGRLYQHRRNTPKALCLSRLPFSSAYIEPSLWYSVFPQSMVGRVGVEPTVYLTSRVYSPLQSPLCLPAHMVREMGLEPTRHLPHAPQTCLYTIPTFSHMERMTRLELAPSAWKADMLATRHHIRIFGSLKVYQPILRAYTNRNMFHYGR